MQITYRVAGKTLYLYPEGEIDEASAAELRRRTDGIIDGHTDCDRVVFNLSSVRFMDSTGIGFLIGRYKKLDRYRIPMFLENPNFSADKVLSVSGIYSLIPKI